MKYRYRLSSAQRKEALVRGKPVRVALPAPPHDLGDALAWARRAIADIDAEDVRSAEEMEITINPLRGRAANPTTLTELIGQIDVARRDWEADPQWTIQVAVVVAVVCGTTKRHGPTAIQWPRMVLDEREELIH